MNIFKLYCLVFLFIKPKILKALPTNKLICREKNDYL